MADTKIICSRCGKSKKLADYYSSNSPIHIYNKKIPICKKCLLEIVDPEDVRSVANTLRMIDRPFISDLYDASAEEAHRRGSNIFQIYMKNVVMHQHKEKNWDDSAFEAQITSKKDTTSNNYVDSGYSESKWGVGYTQQEYAYFEKKYDTLKNHYPEKTSMHTEALLTYIRYRVKEELATARGDIKEAKEWGGLASSAAKDAKINPSQLSQADLTGGLDTIGQLVRAVEQSEDIIPVLPTFKSKPKDKPDFTIWSYINYARDLEGKPLVDYKDVYDFYNQRIEEYESEFGQLEKGEEQ